MDLNPPSQTDHWTFRRVMVATLVLVCVALGFWLLYRYYQVIFILFVAIMLGTVIRPIVNWLYRRGIPRVVGVLIIYMLLLAFVIGFILLLFPLVFDQGSAIVSGIPEYYQNSAKRADRKPRPVTACGAART